MLAQLRQGVGGNIADLIQATVQALRLDIELDANEARREQAGADAHANLDVFIDTVEHYLAIDTHGTLASLLEWIERATEADEAAEHVVAPAPGTVQLITAHGAKGLEWDLVAVPRLVAGEFPGSARSGAGWLRTGQLPDELRGDANARPELNWRIAQTQKELRDRIVEYRAALAENHAEEERRLAYVAVTRSARRLLLSGSFWGGQTRQRGPSCFLTELHEAGLLGPSLDDPVRTELPEQSEYEEDPSESSEMTLQWPLDPLGSRAPAVFRAATEVRAALDQAQLGQAQLGEVQPDQEVPAEATAIEEVVQLLIAERRAMIRGREEQSASGRRLPERVTASTFHEFVEDPQEAERRRLRPVPQRPYRRTRIGNRFHEWVERRATTARGTALPLTGFHSDAIELDPSEFTEFEHGSGDAAELQPLIEQFEKSRWAMLRPIAVEQEVTLPFAGRILVCKLDAVYRSGDGDMARTEIVDWKAGRPPCNEEEKRTRFFQLDLYRHAYAQWAGIDPERIDVSLFYVAEGEELSGGDPRSLEELERIWLEAAEKLS
nr:3'-5' exonuclease [Leucobacter insecticola]